MTLNVKRDISQGLAQLLQGCWDNGYNIRCALGARLDKAWLAWRTWLMNRRHMLNDSHKGHALRQVCTTCTMYNHSARLWCERTVPSFCFLGCITDAVGGMVVAGAVVGGNDMPGLSGLGRCGARLGGRGAEHAVWVSCRDAF